MLAIINERQLTAAQEEEIELRESHPEKYEQEFDPDFEFRVNKKAADPNKSGGYTTYTREQVAALLAASKAPPKAVEPIKKVEYSIMSREECERLVREHFQYLEEQQKKKIEYENKEKEQWGSQKTTESDIKTVTTTKPMKSTKTSKSSASRKKK